MSGTALSCFEAVFKMLTASTLTAWGKQLFFQRHPDTSSLFAWSTNTGKLLAMSLKGKKSMLLLLSWLHALHTNLGDHEPPNDLGMTCSLVKDSYVTILQYAHRLYKHASTTGAISTHSMHLLPLFCCEDEKALLGIVQ